MNAVFRPEIRQSLSHRLKFVQTISNEACSRFLISRDPKKVRMNLIDLKQTGNLEQSMDHEEICDLIFQRGQEEMEVISGNGTSEKAVALRNSKVALTQVAADLTESTRKMKEISSNAMGEQISRSFVNFLGRIDEARFEERLDQLLAEEAARNSRGWESELRKKLLGALDNLEKEFSETLQVCKATISSLLEDDPSMPVAPNPKEVNGFAKESIKELGNAKRDSWICCGQGGIAKRPGSMDFLAMSWEGSLALCNGVSGQLIKELNMFVANGEKRLSCVEFSPSGKHFVKTSFGDKELFTFNTSDFVKKDKWTMNENEYITRARWIDEDRILAGYGGPGHLAVYQLGAISPIFKIAPAELASCAVIDIDISRDRNFAFCGSGGRTKTVFKVGINSKSSSMLWKHNAHEDMINSIRLSFNEKYVLSTGDDKKAVLASANDGTFLSSFNGFTKSFILFVINNSGVFGVLWCPGDRRVFLLSNNELVLLEVGQDGKSLKKIEELKKEDLGLNGITGLNGFWGNETKSIQSQLPFLVLGGSDGKVFRVELK
jgi:WD40 repeat protein